jgi:hypothetical protein
MDPATNPRVLVVFYSRTGNTLRAALRLARLANADLEVIQDATCRHGLRGYLRSALEALTGRHPRIRDLQHDPSRYDVVIVATPVWSGSVSSPIRTYLTRFSSVLPATAFVATFRGRGARRTLAQMSALARSEPLATLPVRSRDARTRPASVLDPFYDAVFRAWQRRWAARAGAAPHPSVQPSTEPAPRGANGPMDQPAPLD